MKQKQSISISGAIISLKNWLVRYRITLFLVAVSCIFGFMIWRISQMSTAEPTEEQKSESVQSIKIDENAIKVIRQLEDKNIAIETLLEPGRYDPFSD